MDFYELEADLRDRGFVNVEEGPICRFSHPPLLLDVMPTNAAILGFTNRWYATAIGTASRTSLPSGATINLITPECFLATKLEAFASPNREDHDDMFLSRDFEDVVAVMDGRPGIVEDVRGGDQAVRAFLRESFDTLLPRSYLDDAVEGHLAADRVSRVRVAEVLRRMRAITELNP